MAVAVLNLAKKSITDVIEKMRKVVAMMTGNLDFLLPIPKLPDVTVEIDDLALKFQDAEKGGTDKKALMRLALKTLKVSAGALTGYVQSASNGDEAKILSTGMDVKRPRTPVGILHVV